MRDHQPDVHELLAAVGDLDRIALAALLAAVAGRLAEPDVSSVPPVPPPIKSTGKSSRWLTAAEVAERLGRDRRWVWRRACRWDFTHREGRVLLFSEAGLNSYMERHRLNGNVG